MRGAPSFLPLDIDCAAAAAGMAVAQPLIAMASPRGVVGFVRQVRPPSRPARQLALQSHAVLPARGADICSPSTQPVSMLGGAFAPQSPYLFR
jgi:hypothetical protein